MEPIHWSGSYYLHSPNLIAKATVEDFVPGKTISFDDLVYNRYTSCDNRLACILDGHFLSHKA